MQVIKVLVDPSQGLRRLGRHFDNAVVNAAFIGESGLRWEILMLLTNDNTTKISQIARSEIFMRASKVNDLTLAKWAMSHGAVDLFGFMPDFAVRPTPLSEAVVNDHFEILHLILDNINTFVPAVAEKLRHRTFSRAYRLARRCGKLEAFLALMKFQHEMTPEKAFIDAARMDGASCMVEDSMGIVDIHAAASPRPFCAPGDNIGQRALYFATNELRFLNIQFLLKRGCTLRHDATSLRLDFFELRRVKSDRTLIPMVKSLPAEHGMTVSFCD